MHTLPVAACTSSLVFLDEAEGEGLVSVKPRSHKDAFPITLLFFLLSNVPI